MNLLSGAGLGDLIGSSKYSWRVRRVMAKKAPKYERKDALKAPPFRIENMTDGLISKHIQTNYGKPPVKKFDWVKAALRADKLSPADKKWEEVHKPEYWGLYWATDAKDTNPAALKPISNGGKGENWVNSDGIQFPPVKYDGYYALRHIGDDAPNDGEEIRTARGKDLVERQRVRSNMLYFRADDMPDFEELPEFGKNINRALGKFKTERVPIGENNPITVEKKVKQPYTGTVYKKEYNGITLIGTDRVMAKSDRKGSIAPVDEDGKPFTGPTKTEVKETEEAAEQNEIIEPAKGKEKSKRLKPKVAKKKGDSDEEPERLEDISYYDSRRTGYKSLYNYLITLFRNIKDYNNVIKKKGEDGIEKDSFDDLIGRVVNYKPADIDDNDLIKFMLKDFSDGDDDEPFAAYYHDNKASLERLEKDDHLDEFIDIARRVATVPGSIKEIWEKYQWAV